MEKWCKGRKIETSPGPAAYAVPSSFGSGPKYTLKGRHKEKPPDPEPPLIKMPSTLRVSKTSFGCRPKSRQPDITPGPYNISYKFGSDQPKCSIRPKRERSFDNGNPGPADYTISRELFNKKKTILSGPRTDFVDKNIILPPGVYDIPSLFDQKNGITIGPSIPLPEPKRYGPGPSKYSQRVRPGTGARSSTISPRIDIPIKDSPGPADYQQIKPFDSNVSQKVTIKNRTTIPNDQCNAPYYGCTGCMTPRKISFGSRPSTSYETISPGPIYELPSSIEYHPITIGERFQQHERNDTPGPGEYFHANTKHLRENSKGFIGPSERFPVTKKDIPGPGEYENIERFYKFKKGFYFTSRDMSYMVKEKGGEYIAQISSLGGPKYTIGNKDNY
ncbi:H-SHIPPO 1 [Histomonas meleagridis]|uniref:H-SHIPPO 1 n=1 Tax=Histomonas meleagridis TaxID=135588 RepID=UPI003559D5EA|nr:H-SHIPPO 1 [Histomonas meleagridis]KAH0802649.1 H-SHIPPO 1 [Histomonas meleagridis]